MTAGLPVVATTVNAVPNIVVAGETGLLAPPCRPELLARAIGYLLDNPVIAARLGAAGRARLGEELTPAALAEVLDQTYQLPRADGPQVAAWPTAALVRP
jgi:glycosyltransferase involved in cell wall biosynthesis